MSENVESAPFLSISLHRTYLPSFRPLTLQPRGWGWWGEMPDPRAGRNIQLWTPWSKCVVCDVYLCSSFSFLLSEASLSVRSFARSHSSPRSDPSTFTNSASSAYPIYLYTTTTTPTIYTQCQLISSWQPSQMTLRCKRS